MSEYPCMEEFCRKYLSVQPALPLEPSPAQKRWLAQLSEMAKSGKRIKVTLRSRSIGWSSIIAERLEQLRYEKLKEKCR